MTKWFSDNQRLIIKLAFLIPIISVAAISISHVIRWYGLSNPISWAVYLSIAIEIAAMSAIAAASVKVRGFSVWFVFIIVTFIQFVGNIYFSYTEINESSKLFKQWMELTLPVMDSMGINVADPIAQKRVLALLEGGLLPLISLTCLHFFIKYDEGAKKTAALPIVILEEEELREEAIDVPNKHREEEVKLEEDDEAINTTDLDEEPKAEPGPNLVEPHALPSNTKPGHEGSLGVKKAAKPVKKTASLSDKMKRFGNRSSR